MIRLYGKSEDVAKIRRTAQACDLGHFGTRKGHFANKNREKSQKNATDFEAVLLMAEELCAIFCVLGIGKTFFI
jgi:hypothetical protein